MPYIGKEPVAGNFVLLDSITTSATATYALTKDSVAYSPESARNMIVSLNGVTQAPETAFTVSGSNITFSSALTASDVIDYILVLGDVLSVGTPSDGTVGTSQMSYPLGNFSSTGIDDNATSTAITIDSSENVGVGTTSPLNKFVVSEGTGQHGIELAPGTTSYIQAYDRAIADYGDLKIDAQIIQFGTDNGTERMRISSAGDVQIGTAAVTGGRYFDIYNTGSTATDFAITRFITQQVGSSSTTSADIIKRKNGEFGIINNDTDSAAHINFKVGASERMRIDSSGNVLVGQTSAYSGTGTTITGDGGISNATASGVASSLNLAGIIGVSNGFQITTNTSNQHEYTFLNGGSVAAKIDTAGKVGVGITNPSGSLHVTTKDASGSDVYYVAQNTTSNRVAGYRVLDESGATSLQMQYDNGGNAASIINPNNGTLSIYLGGTGAANALDDYEEGVHTTSVTAGSGTPTIASTEDSVSYTVVGDSVFISGQLGSIICSGCSGALYVTMPFTTKTNTDRSDFYFILCFSTISTIDYFYLSQTGGGSSTFVVNAKKSDGSIDSNVATLLASHGAFDLNIIGGTYKKS